jgi:hypothetical protein
MSKRFLTFAGTAVLLFARLAGAQDQVTGDNSNFCATSCNAYLQDGALSPSPQSYLDVQQSCSTFCSPNQSSSDETTIPAASDNSGSSSTDTGDDGGSDSGGDDGGAL